jgi:hypothetical protein
MPGDKFLIYPYSLTEDGDEPLESLRVTSMLASHGGTTEQQKLVSKGNAKTMMMLAILQRLGRQCPSLA